MKYKALLFAPNGASVSDFSDRDTIEQVWESLANMGSRWIFYPFMVVAEENEKIVEGYEDTNILEGMSRKQAEKYISKNSSTQTFTDTKEEPILL